MSLVDPLTLYSVIFAGCALAMFFLAKPLTKTTDQLGNSFGLSQLFLGMVLLSAITSLPEAATSLASLWPIQAPDLAVGNILGSNIFNLLVLPILAVLYQKNYLYRVTSQHLLSGLGVLILSSLIGWGLVIPPEMLGLSKSPLLHPITPIILGGYLVCLYLIHSWPPASKKPRDEPESVYSVEKPKSKVKITLKFLALALVVIGLGIALAYSGDVLSRKTGLGQTFFGSLFLAFATSLPEVLICWSALINLDAVNITVGNITGSCLFNLGILSLFDFVFPGNIFAVVDPNHIITLLGGILMMALTSFAMLIRPDKPADGFFPPEMYLLTITYLVTLYLIY